MKRFRLQPAWIVFKRKLKARYRHLSEADLASVEKAGKGWVQQLQLLLGSSPLEIARLAEETFDRNSFRSNAAFLARFLDEELSNPSAFSASQSVSQQPNV